MPKAKKEKKVKALLRKLFLKWYRDNNVGEKIDNHLIFGEPLVINKETGEISNTLPPGTLT